MKKALLVGAAIAAMLAAPAMAADLPAKAPVYNAPVAAPYNWTGLYIGANAGYGWGNQAIGVIGDPLIVQPGFLTPNGISSVSGNPKGFVGGGQIGYNWQSGQMVYGVEADFDAAHIASSQDIHFIAGIPRTVHGDQNLNWLGTLRGRLGFTPVDRLLVYATGWTRGRSCQRNRRLLDGPASRLRRRYLRNWLSHEQDKCGMDCRRRTGIRADG